MRKRIIKFRKKCKEIKGKIRARISYVSKFRPHRVRGKWMLVPEYEQMQYDAVNIDINNTCNLRCRFCFNTFEHKHTYMTKEIFERILPILPMTKSAGDSGTGVYLSCLYEPSLSPYFLDFLDMLPVEGRRNVFFTSNFCRPWTEEQLKHILKANLHHINISIETLKKDRYEEITSSRHFDSFYKNIHSLARIYVNIRGGVSSETALYYNDSENQS